MKKKQTFETIEDQAGKKAKKGKQEEASGKKRWGFYLSVALGLLLAVLVVGAGYLVWMLNRPQDLFMESEISATEEPATERMEAAFDLSGFATLAPEEGVSIPQSDEPIPGEAAPAIVSEPVAAAEPAPEPAATAAPETEADPTAAPVQEVQDNIVNILLMGIDAFEDGSTTSGSEPHTDVMMVVAVNFDKDRVDLITLPRDIFTTAPGLHGFYKLNGVFNAGGGMQNMEGGFALIRRTAEIWLGGISIPYYYAVDFQAVVDIVDAIGGIDYDVDQAFTAYAIVNNDWQPYKHYDLGMQHLNGEAVLQYLRIRHAADGLDSSRTARQRRMMVAIFNKLKTEGKMSQIPELINAATSGIYTNTTLSQTTTLANYAMTKIEPDQIQTRSIYGDIWYQHYFKYCFVDQQNRINVIKEVYGIDAEPIGVNTPQFENWLYDIGFLSMKYVRQPEKVFRVIQEQKDQGKAFTDEQIAAYAACYQAYTALDEGFAACSERMQKAYVDTSLTEEQVKALEKEVKARLEALNKNVQTTTLALRSICDIHLKLEWEVGTRWFVDEDINEVIVAFG